MLLYLVIKIQSWQSKMGVSQIKVLETVLVLFNERIPIESIKSVSFYTGHPDAVLHAKI